MTFSYLLTILKARFRLAATVFAAVILITAVVTLTLTPRYTSTAAVVIDNKAIDPLVGVVLSNNGVLPGYMATQLDIAQSERVILQAIRALQLDKNPAALRAWRESPQAQEDFQHWMVRRIQKQYIVRPSRESSALTLAFVDADPKSAADMTNALMQAYIDTTVELRTEPAKQYSAFFEAQTRQLRDMLEQAQTRLSTYQRQNGLTASDDQNDIEAKRMAELSSQYVVSQDALVQAGGRLAEANRSPNTMAEVLADPVVSELQLELSRQEARIQELGVRLGQNNPQVIEAQSSVLEVRSRLEAAKRAATGSVAVTNSVSRARKEQAAKALEQQQARVLLLKSKRDEAAVLQRDVENAHRAYDAAATRLAQVGLESQNRQTNVAVLQRAHPEVFPSSPRIGLNIIVALVVGALLALTAVTLRESSDRRLRLNDDVLLGLNQTLLLVLPRASTSGKRETSRLLHMKTRVLSGLPRPNAG